MPTTIQTGQDVQSPGSQQLEFYFRSTAVQSFTTAGPRNELIHVHSIVMELKPFKRQTSRSHRLSKWQSNNSETRNQQE
eukprot:6461537-Amphidinium_carterae.1